MEYEHQVIRKELKNKVYVSRGMPALPQHIETEEVCAVFFFIETKYTWR